MRHNGANPAGNRQSAASRAVASTQSANHRSRQCQTYHVSRLLASRNGYALQTLNAPNFTLGMKAGALRWLSEPFGHDRLRSVRQRPLLRCFAAADAMAEGETVGVCGWIVSSAACGWFAEQGRKQEVRQVWSQLHKPPSQLAV